METFNTKINSLNHKFKSNAFVSGLINFLILGLVLVFFSIGFDLTKKLLFDFINLSWGSIFPSIVDLATVAGLIAVLKSFTNILKRSDFLLHLEEKVEGPPLESENQQKVVDFLANNIFGELLLVIWSLIVLFVFNCVANLILEGINNQLSPLNETYLLSSMFTHLPIFPINLLSIFILMVVVLPTSLQYIQYKLEIAEFFDLQPSKTINKKMIKSELDDMKGFRWILFIVLAIICIILSIVQRNNAWIFQYNKPISEEKVLGEELTGKASTFCEENITFNTIHKQNVMTATVSHLSGFNSNPTTTEYNYPITPELKQAIVVKCQKRVEENKKIMEQRKKDAEKELEKAKNQNNS